jgi:hypothetical protein
MGFSNLRDRKHFFFDEIVLCSLPRDLGLFEKYIFWMACGAVQVAHAKKNHPVAKGSRTRE